MRSGEEIQKALTKFVRQWVGYSGSEKAEAQTFLNQLFDCYGTDRLAVGAKFEFFKSSAGFMDLHWPTVCIIEMKAPTKTVESARQQVKDYWEESADEDTDTPAARYVVTCNFNRFEVWEPGRFPKSPRVSFTLEELPSRYEHLLFLTGPEQLPSFLVHNKTLTADAAKIIGDLYESLTDRAAAPADDTIRFTMQAVWTMFAEDLGLLHGSPFQKTIATLKGKPSESAAKIGFLFRLLNQKGNQNRSGDFSGTAYVNGDLFARPAEIGLNDEEIALLASAAEYDWSKIEPTIFGSLLERVISGKLGAHYTHEADIMKIVGPTIIRPWQEQIDAAATPVEAKAVLDELTRFRVLDPACGCGNFLYVAYRELRQLEANAKQRMFDLAASTGLPVPSGKLPYVPLTNFYGIDVEPRAVLLARVTLWMGHRQMIDRFGETEAPLPLVSLAGVSVGDALRVTWPEVDCIIGNPPFLGSQILRRKLGDDYVEWLSNHFGVGVKELCTYWFRIAHDHLHEGQRAGLVGTNSIAQVKGRSVSLDYVAGTGTITDAVSSQKWPGEAKVHVAIVNWTKGSAEGPFILDGQEVLSINSSLRAGTEWSPRALPANAGKCSQGVIRGADGFNILESAARKLLAEEQKYSDVVKRLVSSDDLADDIHQAPSRWVIDFADLPLEDAKKYTKAYQAIELTVKEERASVPRWWQFHRPRMQFRAALSPLSRYIAIGRHGKRLIAAWQEPDVLPSDAINAVALDDDFSMGVISSATHTAWAWQHSSTIKADLRYTPTTVWATFPWPDPSPAQIEAVAVASRKLLSLRTSYCEAESMGLTEIYNIMDDGGFVDLAKAHRQLDVAAADCYGWSAEVAQDIDALRGFLLDLNRTISENPSQYKPPWSGSVIDLS
ncbi:DNA methyltransferase [Mycobacterium sp.]|uniref:DNA methyltransferase n=1 Tax=Mycobacterium sp. TaxID=1785 RepID=UPI003D6AECDE